MLIKQKTIQRECKISGVGLHTGCKADVKLKPAAENSGITFTRIDLPGNPVVKAVPSSVNMDLIVPRCTTIGRGENRIHTVEHLMSVLVGLGVSNLAIEINAPEMPGLDGSALELLKLIKNAGVVEQNASQETFTVKEPLGVEKNGSAIYIVPAADYRISYTLDYPNPFLRSQFFSTAIDEKIFEENIAPARTFCLEEESVELKKAGLGRGANNQNTLVFGKKGVIDNQLRFPDECARHKVLDLMGDLSFLGMPLRGHIFAVKSGHALNMQLLKKIVEQKERFERKGVVASRYGLEGLTEFNANDIMKILPHRYPFLLIDRVIQTEKGKKAVGIKNVTMNDNFFQGHFPSKPVMPGVLMVEAMAQTAGVIIWTNEERRDKLAFFLSADNVKFRKVVVPGDQLLMEVEIIKDRARFVQIRGVAKVNNEIVAEADLILSYTDASFLDS